MFPPSTDRSPPPHGAPPRVSVIIPTVDRRGFLDAALASVARQEGKVEVEVIVVNDGGRSVAQLVHEWTTKLAVTLIELEDRRGPGAARNVAIDVAQGEYIAFLDDDDLFMPGHLAAGSGALMRDEADLVYLGAVVANRRVVDFSEDQGEFPLKAYSYDPRLLLVANYLHTGSVIVRNFRETTVRFDESLSVCEDWDLWIALTVGLGYRVAFVDEITTVYHQVPNCAGLVARAQLSSPSAFELAREYIHAKWPSSDPQVVAYRDWMTALERFRSNLIARKRRMPNLLFDEILEYLQRRMSSGAPPKYADIDRFFGQQ